MNADSFVEFFPLVLALIIAIRASYSDMKCGKVWNRDLKITIYLIGTYYLVLILLSLFGILDLRFSYFVLLSTNLIFATCTSFLMWHFGMWSAGDAKLFIVICLILPMNYYQATYIDIFPSLVLLINIWIPVFIFMIAKLSLQGVLSYVSHFSIASLKKDTKNFFAISVLTKRLKNLSTFIGMFLLFCLMINFIRNLASHFDFLFASQMSSNFVVFTILLTHPIHRYMRKDKRVLYYILGTVFFYSLLLYFFSPSHFFTFLGSLISTYSILFIALLMVVVQIFTYLTKSNMTYLVAIKHLKLGMHIGGESLDRIQSIDKTYFSQLGRIPAEGITKDQVSYIFDWHEKHKQLEDNLEVYRALHFVPFILSGLILTIILKGSIAHLFFFAH